jgi:membrane protease YdiL (CAAX protease family)
MKKVGIVLISVVIACIAAQAVIAVTVVILRAPVVSTSPQIITAIIFMVGLSIAILVGVVIFKKLYGYLKKEFQNV